MLVDYHIHTKLCNHALGEMQEYIDQATKRNISQLGFSEHSPWMIQKKGIKLTPTYQEMDYYISRVRDLQTRYNTPDSPLSILLGIEADFVPEKLNHARTYFETHDFDYVIGSVHHLNGWGFDNPDETERYYTNDITAIYEHYFSVLQNLIDSRVADIIGHIDIVKKFGFRPPHGYLDFKKRAVENIADAGIVVELNTSGFEKPAKEFYPDEETLHLLYEADVPVTLSSDAHAPEEVGRHFTKAVEILRKIGYDSLAVFKGRKRSLVPLEYPRTQS